MKYEQLPNVTVIGITGAARSGKDELAKAILRAVPGAERFAFSDAVASIARARYDMATRNASLLQEIGTLYRGTRGPNIWLDCLYGAIADRLPRVAIVTGVRYPNELELIAAMGGALVGVRRAGRPPLTDRDPAHEVESHIDRLLRCAELVVEAGEYGETTIVSAFDAHARRVLDRLYEINGVPV
jgi:hypothetical protein